MKRLVFTQTRPPPAAVLKRLRELDIEGCWHPLLELQADISGDFRRSLRNLDGFHGVIVVSRFAASLALSQLADCWPELPAAPGWYAVGSSTARTLRQGGIRARVADEETSEGLLSLPELQRVAGQRWWLLAGRGGRKLLAQTLRARGAEVEIGYLYRRLPKSLDAALLREGVRTAFCVSSAAALAALAASFEPHKCAACRLVVPSERLARLARTRHGFTRLQVAEAAQSRFMTAAALQLLEAS